MEQGIRERREVGVQQGLEAGTGRSRGQGKLDIGQVEGADQVRGQDGRSHVLLKKHLVERLRRYPPEADAVAEIVLVFLYVISMHILSLATCASTNTNTMCVIFHSSWLLPHPLGRLRFPAIVQQHIAPAPS